MKETGRNTDDFTGRMESLVQVKKGLRIVCQALYLPTPYPAWRVWMYEDGISTLEIQGGRIDWDKADRQSVLTAMRLGMARLR